MRKNMGKICEKCLRGESGENLGKAPYQIIHIYTICTGIYVCAKAVYIEKNIPSILNKRKCIEKGQNRTKTWECRKG